MADLNDPGNLPKTPAEAVERAKEYLHDLLVYHPWPNSPNYNPPHDFLTRHLAQTVYSFVSHNELSYDRDFYVLLAGQLATALTSQTKQLSDWIARTPVPVFTMNKPAVKVAKNNSTSPVDNSRGG